MRTLIVLCASEKNMSDRPAIMEKHATDEVLLGYKAIQDIFPESYDRIIYTFLRVVVQQHNIVERLQEVIPPELPVEFCLLDTPTSGPAESAYLTIQSMNVQGEVFVRDSHNYIKLAKPVKGNCIAGVDLTKFNGTIENLRSKSFIVLNEQKQVLDIVEKSLRSDVISVGLYGFRNTKDFIKVYERLNDPRYPVGKLYLSHIISYLIGYYNHVFYGIEVAAYEDWSRAGKVKRLLMVDLDGTLFDTKDVNYYAYKKAVNAYGYEIDYTYYREFCNGRHYMEFLPQITTNDSGILNRMHEIKKEAYSEFLHYARMNESLVAILAACKSDMRIALVTTASKRNVMEILAKFEIAELFDLILTRDDITKSKPDPEGYLKALEYFGMSKEDALIFEDSDVGIEAANRCGVSCVVVKGFN